MDKYYKLPIKFDSIFEDGDGMSVCNEKESIDQNLELLITTCPGEHRFDKNFGCGIWYMDFERIVSRSRWEEQFITYITNAVRTYETRLKNISVNLDVREVTREDFALQTTAVKKKVMVYINGNLISNDEYCGFYYSLYLGPLSTE